MWFCWGVVSGKKGTTMQPLRGILYKILAVCMFMGMASFVKAASGDVPPGQAVFFRSFFALPIIFGWLAVRGELRTGWKTQNHMGHFWRGLVGTSAMGLGFTGLGLLPLPEVTAIGYAAPIFVVIFAAMLSAIQLCRASNLPSLSRACRSNSALNCDWPPERTMGVTRERAMAMAAALPRSSSMIASAMSMPAVMPAEVQM